MIPKIIHYCWFGRGEMPQLAIDCISSWHKFMPDWEYKLWNEDSFDINSNDYVREAYNARKFAFVTDYVRLYALSIYGGVYMDTDVEILKPLDDLINLSAFTGYEGSKHRPPVTGLIASQPNGYWVNEQLDAYKDRHFILEDGSMDLTTNTQLISSIMHEHGFVQNGEYQVYNDMHIFPVDFFCPRQTTGEILFTKNTYCDHHFMGSWSNPAKKSWKQLVKNVVGDKFMVRIIKIKRKLIG